MTNLLSKVRRSAQPWCNDGSYDLPAAFGRGGSHAAGESRRSAQRSIPDVASVLDEAGADALAFIDFPGSHWKQV